MACMRDMRRVFLLVLVCLAVHARGAEPARLKEKAEVLPLALDDAFQFRKTKIYVNDSQQDKKTDNPVLVFERQRMSHGAVSAVDRRQREGYYFTFFWRTSRAADLKVRLEYRQQNLGSFVEAQEVPYPGAKGSRKTEFKVIGDDYRDDGKVTAWRALLIENGHIVAVTQSFLWN
jgi:hypothetical protein